MGSIINRRELSNAAVSRTIKKGVITMNKDTLEGQWKQLSGKAKAAWGDLTDDELTKTNGNVEQLAGLIQEKYGRTREEADREVKEFFDRNR